MANSSIDNIRSSIDPPLSDYQIIADASRNLVIRAFGPAGDFIERLTLGITTSSQSASTLVGTAGGTFKRHSWWRVESTAGTIYALPTTGAVTSTNGWLLAAQDKLGPALPDGMFIASQEPTISATLSGISTEAKQDTMITSLQALDDLAGLNEYETVAASQTAQVLGASGATGDWIAGLLVIPATTSPGNVLLLDNSTSITIFAGGASSVSNLVPFFVPLGMKSVSGAWKVTTGSNVSVIATGNFT